MTLYIGGVFGQDQKIHFTCTFPEREETEKHVNRQADLIRQGGRKVSTFIAPLQEA